MNQEKTLDQLRTAAVLLRLGILPDLIGYYYLISAVQYWIDHSAVLPPSVTKEIYPDLAKFFGKTPCSVERGIRSAVDSVMSYELGQRGVCEFFGVPYMGQSFSNSQFIALLADRIIQQKKKDPVFPGQA